MLLTVFTGHGSLCLKLGVLSVARQQSYSMRRCWTTATLSFDSPLGLSPSGEHGFREKPLTAQLPVYRPTTGQPAPGESLTWGKGGVEVKRRRAGRRRMVSRRGTIVKLP